MLEILREITTVENGDRVLLPERSRFLYRGRSAELAERRADLLAAGHPSEA